MRTGSEKKLQKNHRWIFVGGTAKEAHFVHIWINRWMNQLSASPLWMKAHGLKYLSVSSVLPPQESGQMAIRLGHFLHGGGSSQSWLTVSPLRLQRKLLIPNAQKDANGSGFTGSGIFVHKKGFNLKSTVAQKVHYCIKVCLYNHKLFIVFICRHQPSPTLLSSPTTLPSNGDNNKTLRTIRD